MVPTTEQTSTEPPLPSLTCRWTPMPQLYCSHSVGPESYTRPGSNALPGRTCPAPKSSGVAAPPKSFWIGLPMLSTCPAVVMMADLTAIGDQVGFLLRIRAAMPAMCGVAIEVPDSVSHRLPLWLPGATPAITSTPGAIASGLSRSPLLLTDGPRDENAATAGASALTCTAALSE